MFLTTRGEPARPDADYGANRPLCPNCGRPMHLARIVPGTARMADLPAFKCGECGIWATESADDCV